MPKHKVRKGFAPTKNKYGGFRDKSGQTFRPGKSVFVLVPYQQWGNLSTGVIPARFFRTFAWAQDKLGAYRLDAWMLNHDMLIELGACVTAAIPEDIMQEMAADSKKVVETPWPVSDEFETLFSDVSMQGFFSPPPVGPRIDAYTHMGTLNLGITPSGNLKKNKGGFNFATGFKTWTQGDTLESMVPATLKGALPAFDGLQPCSADYGVGAAERMPQQVARGGGPELNDGAELKVGADELEIFGVEYERDGSGDDDPLRDFSTGFAFITSNAYADPLQGVEMLDHNRLAALATNEDTLALLAEPELSKRLFLNNHGELLPGWRQVEFNRTSIVRTILSLNPALLEGATLLHGAEDTFTFECAARAGGALVSLRRCGEKLARTRVAQLAGPSPRALRGVVKTWLQDVLQAKALDAKRNLDPLEFTVPCPFAYVVALPGFAAMRRSPKLRHVLTHVLSSSDDADTILGILGWHAPIGKEKNGFYLISVPELPLQVQGGATIDPRRVAGLSKHQYNFFSYDTEAQTLTLRLSVARFNASLRVRGASVGKPPAQPPPAGGRWKFSLLERAWVPSGVRAPTPRELKERYPAGPQWMHW